MGKELLWLAKSHAVSRSLLLFGICVGLIGYFVGNVGLYLPIVPNHSYNDIFAIAAVLLAFFSLAISIYILPNRCLWLTQQKSICLVKARIGIIIISLGICSWPFLLCSSKIFAQMVIPLISQQIFLLGLSGTLCVFEQRIFWVPVTVCYLLAFVGNSIPLSFHPLVPAAHPPVLVISEIILGSAGIMAYLIAGPRHFTARRLRQTIAPSQMKRRI